MSIEEKIAAAEKCKADVTVAFKVGDFAAPEEDEDDIPVSQLRLRHPLLRPPKKIKRIEPKIAAPAANGKTPLPNAISPSSPMVRKMSRSGWNSPCCHCALAATEPLLPL